MSEFQWTKEKGDAALALAEGKSRAEVAESADITERTLYRWLNEPDFSAEVDRLSLMIGIASRAERLRIAQRIVRQKTAGEMADTDKDLLDWLKFAQSETDGVKLDMAKLMEAVNG